MSGWPFPHPTPRMTHVDPPGGSALPRESRTGLPAWNRGELPAPHRRTCSRSCSRWRVASAAIMHQVGSVTVAMLFRLLGHELMKRHVRDAVEKLADTLLVDVERER